jgi:hypothetical protein
MKIKKIILSCLIVFSGKIIAQQTPTGTANTTITPWVPATSGSAWFRGGNFAGGGAGNNNLFGTALNFNSPIYTITNGALRMKLNGDFNIAGAPQYFINGYNNANGVNTSGYLLLGQDGQTQGGNPSLFTSKGAFSLLHLTGPQSPFGGGFVQESGYRPWMQTGITFTGNNDLMYVGVRGVQGQDVTEMSITWSDNNAGGFGITPDDLVFRFTASGAAGGGNFPNSANSNIIDPNLQSQTDLDGLHVARFTPTGEFALGNTFGIANPLYVRPQSLFHMSLDQSRPVWAQMTNQVTGQTIADGFRWGILGDPTIIQNGNVFMYNQEQRHIIFSTGNATPASINATNERMRITAIENPTTLAGGGYGVFNPAALPINRTRIAISHNPTQPITRPLSLLQLGYDVQGATNDGWRPWMDVGMFVSQESDNVFLGLKREPAGAPLGDRMDAVLSWGDNQINSGLPPGNGPDNFRMIFTSSTTPSAGGTPPATSANGLEGLRMTPTSANGIFTGLGGDPTLPNLYGPLANSINPTNTLEVNSWGATNVPGGSSGLRFTNLNTTSPTVTNPGAGVLAVDANGDVIYVPANTGTGIGGVCGIATPLTQSWEVPIDPGFVYNFSSKGHVNITDVTNCTPTAAKLYVSTIANASIASINTNAGGYAGYFIATGTTGTGIYCKAPVTSPPLPIPPSTPPPSSLALFADGDVFVSGTAFLANPAIVSDQQFKINLDSIQSALEIVKQLKPRTFEYTNDAHFNFPAGRNYGFVAQDVEQVIPELVRETVAPATIDSLGNQVLPSLNYKTLNYQGIIPVLTKAIQEQQLQLASKDSAINSLNDRLTALENCINALNLCGNPQAVNQNNTVTAIPVELSDAQAIVLEQNVPNPFAEQTTINYFLPENVAKAQMLFYNAQGKLIQSVELSQKGKGSINVFAQDLSSGIYTYTLVADGKIVETKKMIKQ